MTAAADVLQQAGRGRRRAKRWSGVSRHRAWFGTDALPTRGGGSTAAYHVAAPRMPAARRVAECQDDVQRRRQHRTTDIYRVSGADSRGGKSFGTAGRGELGSPRDETPVCAWRKVPLRGLAAVWPPRFCVRRRSHRGLTDRRGRLPARDAGDGAAAGGRGARVARMVCRIWRCSYAAGPPCEHGRVLRCCKWRQDSAVMRPGRLPARSVGRGGRVHSQGAAGSRDCHADLADG